MIDTLLADRYRIQAKVGDGGMAVVYKAMDVVLHRIVAIKVLRPQYAGDEEFVQRFRREAQAAASLSHPNVVNIFDVGQDGDVHYIVLEYVQGQNLKEVVRAQGRLAPSRAVQIARAVARALEAAHRRQLIHRDIKPHNILITPEGRVKVTDFGLARAASAATLTETGTVIGSVHYFSPEQARGQSFGPASDLYSLGVVLYELLTGRVPFQGDSPIAVALKHLQEEPVAPRDIVPGIPDWLNDVVLKALAKQPEQRYTSATEMARALLWREDDVVLPASMARRGEASLGLAEPPDFDDTAVAPPEGTKRDELREALMAELNDDGSGDEPAPRPSRWRRFLSVVVFLLLFVGGAYFARPYIIALIFPPEVVVPDVAGLTFAEARPLMDEQGLLLEIEAEQFDPEVPQGRIVQQKPGANRTVRQGRTIQIVLSRGPELGRVPDVTNMPLRDARIVLTQAGYTLGDEVEQSSDDVPPNYVWDQQPAADTELNKGAAVALWVNRTAETAAETIVLPDFRGQPLAAAEAELEDLGLMAGNKWPEFNILVPPDRIIDQNPAPGTELGPGAAVDFVYSEGFVAADEPAGPPPAADDAEDDVNVDWEGVFPGENAEENRREARVDITVPDGRAHEVVILVIDDFGAREVYRETVAGGTELRQFVEGRGEGARLQVYINGMMETDTFFPE